MHDPMTVAFEIPNPFVRRYTWGEKWRNRPSLATIWHVDPEVGGSDDSCGYSYVHLTKADREWAEKKAKAEWPFWLSKEYATVNLLSVDPQGLGLLVAAWQEAKMHAAGGKWRFLNDWDVVQCIGLMSNPHDNLGSVVALARLDAGGLEELLKTALRCYLTRKRPWWRKPRWHVHHWRLSIRPVQNFKRWAFSRCSKCGGRFGWGYAPTTDCWDGDGPQWFKGEPHTYHGNCKEPEDAMVGSAR